MGRSQVLFNRKKGGRGRGRGGPETAGRERPTNRQIPEKEEVARPALSAEDEVEGQLLSIPTTNYAQRLEKEESYLPGLSLNVRSINHTLSKLPLHKLYRVEPHMMDIVYGEARSYEEEVVAPIVVDEIKSNPTDEASLPNVVFSRSESTQRSTTESAGDLSSQPQESWPEGNAIQEEEEELDDWLDSVIS